MRKNLGIFLNSTVELHNNRYVERWTDGGIVSPPHFWKPTKTRLSSLARGGKRKNFFATESFTFSSRCVLDLCFLLKPWYFPPSCHRSSSSHQPSTSIRITVVAYIVCGVNGITICRWRWRLESRIHTRFKICWTECNTKGGDLLSPHLSTWSQAWHIKEAVWNAYYGFSCCFYRNGPGILS